MHQILFHIYVCIYFINRFKCFLLFNKYVIRLIKILSNILLFYELILQIAFIIIIIIITIININLCFI